MSTLKTVINNAALLLSEDGENPEYDRAIVELTSAALGVSSDDYDAVERLLRGLKQ